MATIELTGTAISLGQSGATFDCYDRSRVRELLNLLPVGPMWPRDDDTVIYQFVSGQALELSRIHKRARTLAEKESDPNAALETLDGWERITGLPDCKPLGATLTERRADVVEVLEGDTDQTLAFYTSLASSFGYTAPTITSGVPFCAGENCAGEDAVCSQDALATKTWAFTSGAKNAQLECAIRKFAPDYITLVINFT